MEYTSVLQKLEEQKNSRKISAELFRYAGLIKAIEFFSQRLTFEQIIDYAFDFVNELLTLERSCIFALEDNSYVLKRQKGFPYTDTCSICSGSNLNKLALLHGSMVTGREMLLKYFDSALIDQYAVTEAMPLIVDGALHGFMLLSNKTAGEFDGDDDIITEALMKLFNNALENCRRYEELKNLNNELDEKIFNLFAINQSSKALLSELDRSVLYNLSSDVFSELTQSSVTGFFIYSKASEKYELKAYKTFDRSIAPPVLSLKIRTDAAVDPLKVIIDMSCSSDRLYFDGIFLQGVEQTAVLNPLYIVLLIKKQAILGFVTLGATVTGMPYKNSIFELIESLASSTYIALSNAELFKTVSSQKALTESRLQRLISLNRLMKTINSSSDTASLLKLTTKMLDVAFEVDKAFIALYDAEENCFSVKSTLNVGLEGHKIQPGPQWEKVFRGETLCIPREESAALYLGDAPANAAGRCSGVLIVPICIDRIDIELVGILTVLKCRKLLLSDEENIVLLENIASHLAPVLANLLELEEQKKLFVPDYAALFARDAKLKIKQSRELGLELEVIQVITAESRSLKHLLCDSTQPERPDNVYPVAPGMLLVINTDMVFTDENLKELAGSSSAEIKRLLFGRDFESFSELTEALG